jgi:hypothetical protein
MIVGGCGAVRLVLWANKARGLLSRIVPSGEKPGTPISRASEALLCARLDYFVFTRKKWCKSVGLRARVWVRVFSFSGNH